MRSWKAIGIAIIALVVIGNWIATRPGDLTPTSQKTSEPRPVLPVEPPPSAPAVIPPSPPTSPRPEFMTPPPRSEASRASSRRHLESPLVSSYEPGTPPPRRAENAEPEVAADFDKVTLMLRAYHDVTGENPVGTNAEIMIAVMGGNPKSAQLGPPEGQTLNGNGELVDRWGTPYFFHQLSKDLMEIHSAGPDRRMGTGDDIISD